MDQLNQNDLMPSDPFSKALNYVLRRETSLRVFLEDPDVPLDTNHLERALRPMRLWKTRFADTPLRSLVDPRHPARQRQPLEAPVHAY